MDGVINEEIKRRMGVEKTLLDYIDEKDKIRGLFKIHSKKRFCKKTNNW